jgi:hypothetical protein
VRRACAASAIVADHADVIRADERRLGRPSSWSVGVDDLHRVFDDLDRTIATVTRET